MRREGHDVSHADGARVLSRRHEACWMRDVEHELRAHFVGDLPERGGVDGAGVGRRSGDDELAALPQGQVPHLVEVDPLTGAVGGGRCHAVVRRSGRACR